MSKRWKEGDLVTIFESFGSRCKPETTFTFDFSSSWTYIFFYLFKPISVGLSIIYNQMSHLSLYLFLHLTNMDCVLLSIKCCSRIWEYNTAWGKWVPYFYGAYIPKESQGNKHIKWINKRCNGAPCGPVAMALLCQHWVQSGNQMCGCISHATTLKIKGLQASTKVWRRQINKYCNFRCWSVGWGNKPGMGTAVI